jgi:hypothetical protein
MILSNFKQETIRMKGISYRGIGFGKYDSLQSVWIRSMVPLSGYKKRKKSRIQVGHHFENYTDNLHNKEVLHYVPRINAFLKKQILGLQQLIEHLVEEDVIPYYLMKTEARYCILLFLDFFLQDYMKFENPRSSETRKEAKRQAQRQAQSHPETEFLYPVKIPFFYIKYLNRYINAERDFRNSVKFLFDSLTNNPNMNIFFNWQRSGPAHLLDRCLVESGVDDLIDYILRDAIDIDIEYIHIFIESYDYDKYSNCRQILRASLFQFVDHFFQDFMKLKNVFLSEKAKFEKDEKKGNDWSDYEI